MKKYIITLAALLGFILFLCLPASTNSSPMPPVDQKKACLECHDDMSAMFTKVDVHQPLTDGKCSACHNPHASRHMQLLESEQSLLCGECHTAVAGWQQSPSVHAPVKSGECTLCHEPHAADHKHLLKKSGKDLCASCHVEVTTWLSRTNVHMPVRTGQCKKCHDPHAGEGDALLAGNQATLCLSCHEPTSQFTTKHKGFNPQTARCTACHDPHSSDSPSLLMPNQHQPFASGECSMCHVAAATPAGYPIQGSRQQVCGQCHAEEVGLVMKYRPHGATDESSCEKCHNPHAAHEKTLLAANQAELCSRCHDPNAAVENPAPNPHAGLQCTSCHAPHGSDNSHDLKEASLDLCAQCHSRQHHVSHPMGLEIVDPLNGGALTCVSCHQLHGAEHKPLLPADGERDLCVRCHRGK